MTLEPGRQTTSSRQILMSSLKHVNRPLPTDANWSRLSGLLPCYPGKDIGHAALIAMR